MAVLVSSLIVEPVRTDLGKRLTRAVRIMLRDGARCGCGVGAGPEARGAGEAAGGLGPRVAGTSRRSPEAEGAAGRVGRRVCATAPRRRTPPDGRRPPRCVPRRRGA